MTTEELIDHIDLVTEKDRLYDKVVDLINTMSRDIVYDLANDMETEGADDIPDEEQQDSLAEEVYNILSNYLHDF